MDRFWKQFVELDTASKHSIFLRARFKLTALYVVIVAVIVFGFSLFLYQSIKGNLRDASDNDFADIESHQHFSQDTLGQIKDDLILADFVILIITAGLSYVLAGKTLKPIQQSVEAQKVFASNASHELRTPLAVMRNDIEVYLRNNSPTKEMTQETMKSNLEEIKQMSGIVEDLLLLARLDNKLAPKYKEVDIDIVIKKIIERIKNLTDSKDIKLAYSNISPTVIRGDHNQLERAILNILQNSVDHAKEGGSIDIKVEKDGDKIVLNIADTGKGIAEKDLPHIFTRFYKGDSATGTGLGLSIVKEIIDKHNGDISIKSILDKGTTVIINLPIK